MDQLPQQSAGGVWIWSGKALSLAFRSSQGDNSCLTYLKAMIIGEPFVPKTWRTTRGPTNFECACNNDRKVEPAWNLTAIGHSSGIFLKWTTQVEKENDSCDERSILPLSIQLSSAAGSGLGSSAPCCWRIKSSSTWAMEKCPWNCGHRAGCISCSKERSTWSCQNETSLWTLNRRVRELLIRPPNQLTPHDKPGPKSMKNRNWLKGNFPSLEHFQLRIQGAHYPSNLRRGLAICPMAANVNLTLVPKSVHGSNAFRAAHSQGWTWRTAAGISGESGDLTSRPKNPLLARGASDNL